MVLSVRAEETCDKIQHPFTRGTASGVQKRHASAHRRPRVTATADIRLGSERLLFLSRQTETKAPLSPLLLSTGLEVLARALRQEKESEVIRSGKEERKLSLLAEVCVKGKNNPNCEFLKQN